MGDETHRAVINQPEDGCIDIPHTPNGEVALIQEMRERLAMLELHMANPIALKKLRQINKNLEYLMGELNKTEEYSCSCNVMMYSEYQK